jgi:hypothetical protein
MRITRSAYLDLARSAFAARLLVPYQAMFALSGQGARALAARAIR